MSLTINAAGLVYNQPIEFLGSWAELSAKTDNSASKSHGVIRSPGRAFSGTNGNLGSPRSHPMVVLQLCDCAKNSLSFSHQELNPGGYFVAFVQVQPLPWYESSTWVCRVQTMSICPNLYNTIFEAPGTQPLAILLCGLLWGGSRNRFYYILLVLIVRALATSISMHVCTCTYRN